MTVRTRVAPSPTGFIHLGTIYQVLFDKAWALKHKGSFIFRSEDTDRARYVKGAEEAVLEALEWFGLRPEEGVTLGGEYGPYRQSERLEIYKKYVDQLIAQGDAYYCFCTKERLESVREIATKEKRIPMYDGHCRNLDPKEAKSRVLAGESYVVRMKMPKNKKITINEVVRGEIEFDSNTIDDQVILKADGFPTYHLAVVVDDHLMEITHIIRAQEWISSAPKHKVLYDMFGWKMPILVHTPAIINMHNGKKLSKRDGHAGVDWYKRGGYLPEAILNFISLLVWSHPEGKEFFDFVEFTTFFELKDLSAASPRFDLTKLIWMNGEYIRKLTDKELLKKITDWLDYCIDSKYSGVSEYSTYWKSDDYVLLKNFISSLSEEKKILWININKERIKKFEDILPLNDFLIKETKLDFELLYNKKSKEDVNSHLIWVKSLFENTDWTIDNLKALEKDLVLKATDLGWSVGDVFYPIRVAVAKSKISPPLFESLYLLGKAEVLKSLSSAIF